MEHGLRVHGRADLDGLRDLRCGAVEFSRGHPSLRLVEQCPSEGRRTKVTREPRCLFAVTHAGVGITTVGVHDSPHHQRERQGLRLERHGQGLIGRGERLGQAVKHSQGEGVGRECETVNLRVTSGVLEHGFQHRQRLTRAADVSQNNGAGRRQPRGQRRTDRPRPAQRTARLCVGRHGRLKHRGWNQKSPCRPRQLALTLGMRATPFRPVCRGVKHRSRELSQRFG